VDERKILQYILKKDEWMGWPGLLCPPPPPIKNINIEDKERKIPNIINNTKTYLKKQVLFYLNTPRRSVKVVLHSLNTEIFWSPPPPKKKKFWAWG
jgi:hypothetical protein